MNIPVSLPHLRSLARRWTPRTGRPSSSGLLASGLLSVLVAACGGSATSAAPSRVALVPPSAASSVAPSGSAAPNASADASAAPGESQAPDTGGGTTVGDVPDNAVFLTYQQASLGF